MARTLTLAPTIAPQVATELRALVAELDARTAKDQAAADAAKKSASGWFSSMFNADGSSTAASSLQTLASGSRSLADAVAGRCQRIGTSEEGLSILREAKASKWAVTGVDVDALARSLTASAAAGRIAADSARDAGRVAVAVGQSALGALKLAPLVLLAVLGFVVFSKVRRAAA